jgi:hypothetical protein
MNSNRCSITGPAWTRLPSALSKGINGALLLLTLGFAAAARAQTPVPASAAFREARSLYYIPADQGLQGFQCNVHFDWKSFLEKANSTTVSDLDQRLLYLQSIRLSVTDDLKSSGSLDWSAPAPPPDPGDNSVDQIRSGFQSLVTGFFETWNGFYTGSIISPDVHAVVDRTSNGFHVFAHEPTRTADELFSPDFTLRSLHVSTPSFDSTLQPSFTNTPQGRLVTALSSTISQPPTAPASTVNMTIHYAPVGGFQIPSELLINVPGTASFDFHFENCTVRTNSATPDPH